MKHISNSSQRIISFISWTFFIIPLFFGISGCKNTGEAIPKTTIPDNTTIGRIEGSVWYRERIMPPPDAEVKITLEDVARMDVASELIASTSFKSKGGPPWDFTLEYDPSKIHDKGRYALRARIESSGKLIFISTEHISAFDRDPGQPLEIMVSKVSSPNDSNTSSSMHSNVILTDTYWKLIELNDQPVSPGAGKKELHMVFNAEDRRVAGFSGCNRFTGGYKLKENQIEFSHMASTSMACMESMEQEQHFLFALENTKQFKINDEKLFMYDADGKILFCFESGGLK